MRCKHCDGWLTMITPSAPGPDGWAERCKTCGYYRDVSAEAKAAAEQEFFERVGMHSWEMEWGNGADDEWNSEDDEVAAL